MIRKKKLALSRETVRVLGTSALSKLAGGWPTGSGMDGQCSGKHSTCIMVTGSCTCPTDDCSVVCFDGGSGSGGNMNCC